MDAKGFETEKNSILNSRPLMISSSPQPTQPNLVNNLTNTSPIATRTRGQLRNMLRANNTTPDLVNSLTPPPTNPNPRFSMDDEDIFSGSESANSQNRSRGRPRGAKNKAKPSPVAVETESPYALEGLLLEIPDGSDIIEILRTHAYENHCGVVVLSSNGNVKDVMIRNISAPSGVMLLPGIRFILSIHGSLLPTPSPPGANGLSVIISNGFGTVIGGVVMGRLVASGLVKISVGTFSNATFMRLPTNPPGDESGASSSSSVVTEP